MSRKRKAPIRKIYPDPRFKSEVVSKFINSIMYDGKRSTAEKILYDALDKIKNKGNDDPLKIFNTAISNVKPNLEVRSRRVGGATYQVPVEVKSKRAQALAIRWLVDSARKRKDKHMSDKIFNELFDAYEKNSNLKKKVLVVAGGVAANKNIRSMLKNLCTNEDYQSVFPPIEMCSDNAAMIALVGLEKYKLKKFDELDFPAKPRWALDESAIFLKGAGVKL